MMKSNKLNLAVLGPGKIAEVVINSIKDKVDINLYAVASRDINRALAFKQKHEFLKAYGSYQDLYKDKEVDLIYITTPHAFHYEQMKECVLHKKNIICEKAFTLNYEDTIEIIELAKKNNVFVGEAMLTAYLPSRKMVKEIIENEDIGDIITYNGVFANNLMHVERVTNKDLGGGSLFDIGIYPLYFAYQLFGNDYKITNVNIKKYNNIDEECSFTLEFSNGLKANIFSSISRDLGIYCDIIGTKGRIRVENVARPSEIIVYDSNNKIIKKYSNIRSTSGYEYEFIETINSIKHKLIENSSMTHQDTLEIMKIISSVLLNI
ncbi:MAG: Gfo/Idh/MocA family oxidoreductase [Bacilli bacterium]